MLFGKLLPREGNFFELFNQHADRIVEAGRAFSQLVANYSDVHLREQYNRATWTTQDSAETMALYDVRHMTEEITRLKDVSVKCCERVKGSCWWRWRWRSRSIS